MACSSSSNNICDDVPQPVKVAKPIGDVVKISAEGTHNQKNHYKAFKFDGNTYELGDIVLLAPDSQARTTKPYVAMIKDINEMENKEIMLIIQWFYRPEDATPKRSGQSGKNMELVGARELYYSFHRDEVSAESVVHKCIVHFVTTQKHIPPRKEYPGFIVQEVYDPKSKRLLKLTSNGFKQDFKEEIHLLVQKTMRNLGILPDMDRVV
ncbi:putative BAH domain-containing protein [Helianthus annuus]|uniref:BAH domain-containing protein n=1 Tax=Helianthus annuus TaxID=4232 RepID=A0A251RKJ3_HELAN|nr:BAH and coiled-coil domain-containing protein 1 [Helianthus annuus]KAF5753336.1 putative BAH domain-containing protein [Helianthus annuus]KAJ0427437.1 putative BAH domain-containing protein [Helianthus annuus]KAJ0431221.1 putative BAH domain-containing protein [Helianthus annuus]KAJ0445711.1 putative BAH domain-containing protein [Helianthus annuus]KAJ0630681.1 putative BAH domain-containing protein [Helianthus annuus]